MKRILTSVICYFLFTNLTSGQADLVISATGFQPDRIDKGEIFLAQAIVTNVGNSVAGANYLFIYYSQDLTVSEDEIISRVSIKELAPNESQEINFLYPTPSTLNSGAYFIGYEIDPFNDVNEIDEDNLYCASDVTGCLTFSITNTEVKHQKFTYPIIFVHGLNGNNTTWDNFVNKSREYYGWSYGGQLDYCLNPDNDVFVSDDFIYPLFNTADLDIGDYYLINFDPENYINSLNCYQSNQSAIVKQGWAVRHAVEQVLNITGAEKVILVGHSMGGLASREYIQNEANWQIDGEHHIAKLFTISTPNGGSAVTGLGLSNLFTGIFEDSEAVRDLRYYVPFLYEAQYLFGGDENALSIYVNDDINCDGDIDDHIIGLNHKPAPVDINYSCMFSSIDEVVNKDRADLNQYPEPQPPFRSIYADIFVAETNQLPTHLKLHKDTLNHGVIIQGLDEPNSYETAYPVPLNSLNYGYSTIQAENKPIPSPDDEIDQDIFAVDIQEDGLLEVDIWNIPVHGFALLLRDENYDILNEVQAIGESNIGFDFQVTAGRYFIECSSIPTANSWRFPYAYSVLFTSASGLLANFSANIQEGCKPLSVNFSNQSDGTPSSYLWSFNGGTPNISNAPNPTVMYNQAGVYPVSLTVSNSSGSNSITHNGFITVKAPPVAGFTFSQQSDTISFINKTQYEIEVPDYYWDFGDTESSTEVSPRHIYGLDGNYSVKLTASNSCGNSNDLDIVNISTVSTENLKRKSKFSIFPNPTNDQFTLMIEGEHYSEYQVSIINNIGQEIKKGTVFKSGFVSTKQFNISDMPNGSYLVRIKSGEENQIKKIVKK